MSGRLCVIDGCGRPQYARGWCERHWKRHRKYGDPRPDIPIGSWRKPKAPKPVPRRVHRRPYATAHYRIAKARGKAAEHPCADCDAAAAHWCCRGDGCRKSS